MSPQLSSILEKTRARLLDWLLPTIGTALAGIVLASESHLAKLIPTQPELWAVRSIALSLVLLGLLLGALFWFRPKFAPTDFGVHKNIKTGAYFCSTCLIPNKIHSPMFLSGDGRFWKCHSNSNHKRANPDFREPELTPNSLPHAQSWMAR
jgi:hypothetical protein